MTIVRANYSIDHNKSDYLNTPTKGQMAGASVNLEYTLPVRLNIKLKTDFKFSFP